MCAKKFREVRKALRAKAWIKVCQTGSLEAWESAGAYGSSPLPVRIRVLLRLFAVGCSDRGPEDNELAPYWLYTAAGEARIERHVLLRP